MASSHTATEGGDDAWEYITEGQCTVMFPKGEVFYNPVQVLNRDLSILFIQLFAELKQAEEEELGRSKPEYDIMNLDVLFLILTFF
jgi:tRNA G26 N,N-dimethylase Trm1